MPLKKHYSYAEYDLDRVYQNEKYYVYVQKFKEFKHKSYEVVKKVIKHKSKIYGKFVGKTYTQEEYDAFPEYREVYPSPTSWGKTAWSYPKLEWAIQKAEELSQK